MESEGLWSDNSCSLTCSLITILLLHLSSVTMPTRKRPLSAPSSSTAKKQRTLHDLFSASSSTTSTPASAPLATIPELPVREDVRDELPAPAPASCSIIDADLLSLTEPELTLHPDVGAYVGIRSISDEAKLKLLTQRWTPATSAQFPTSSQIIKEKSVTRRISPSHLSDFPWLAISQHAGAVGAWCVPCLLFSTTRAAGGQALGKLVTKPLIDYSRLGGLDGCLTLHNKALYHGANVVFAESFVKRLQTQTPTCAQQQETADEAQVLRTRAALTSIIDMVETLAMQNIALRGHRDDGRPDPSGAHPAENDGNFRAALRMRLRSGDTALQEHLRLAPSNATYTSKTTQNEILKTLAIAIKKRIVDEVTGALCWALLADETEDESGRLEACLLVQVNRDNLPSHEQTLSQLRLQERRLRF